jgi:pyruvate formate lyase activating enzyme
LADTASLTGTVLEIQRMSTEDGPGLRTTVFMKGCPMRCRWCHNPESISPQPQIQWIGMRCIGCQTCIGVCPHSVLEFTDGGMVIDRDNCDGCGICVEECPSTALELLGKEWSVSALADELFKDRVYFEHSGGGVTISGGEATLQWKFVSRLLQELKQRGIHTAIDTCGIYQDEALDEILPYTDLMLFDLKEMDPDRHKKFTHASLNLVLDNFRELVNRIQNLDYPIELWIRTPLIPGATARVENLTAIGEFITRFGNAAVARWDLLAFNNLCRDKYTRLGMDWEFTDADLIDQETLDDLEAAARQSGVEANIVHTSGTSKLKEGDVLTSEQKKPASLVCGC